MAFVVLCFWVKCHDLLLSFFHFRHEEKKPDLSATSLMDIKDINNFVYFLAVVKLRAFITVNPQFVFKASKFTSNFH
jgi:hypothetical protein